MIPNIKDTHTIAIRVVCVEHFCVVMIGKRVIILSTEGSGSLVE